MNIFIGSHVEKEHCAEKKFETMAGRRRFSNEPESWSLLQCGSHNMDKNATEPLAVYVYAYFDGHIDFKVVFKRRKLIGALFKCRVGPQGN